VLIAVLEQLVFVPMLLSFHGMDLLVLDLKHFPNFPAPGRLRRASLPGLA
jgi:hypothetical protein